MNDEEEALCLFCDNTSSSIEDALVHVEKDHQFSFQDIQIKFNLDQYGFIKVSDEPGLVSFLVLMNLFSDDQLH